jgi:septal ring factor EnvC (AmiA/AmiB activator)
MASEDVRSSMSVNEFKRVKKQITEMERSLDANRKLRDQLQNAIADIDVALAKSRRFLKKLSIEKPH